MVIIRLNNCLKTHKGYTTAFYKMKSKFPQLSSVLFITNCCSFIHSLIHSFIHSIGMCRMRRFLAVLNSFLCSSLLCTFSSHPSPPTILPSSLTSSCHLFVGIHLNLVVPQFIYNTLLGILFSIRVLYMNFGTTRLRGRPRMLLLLSLIKTGQ